MLVVSIPILLNILTDSFQSTNGSHFISNLLSESSIPQTSRINLTGLCTRAFLIREISCQVHFLCMSKLHVTAHVFALRICIDFKLNFTSLSQHLDYKSIHVLHICCEVMNLHRIGAKYEILLRRDHI